MKEKRNHLLSGLIPIFYLKSHKIKLLVALIFLNTAVISWVGFSFHKSAKKSWIYSKLWSGENSPPPPSTQVQALEESGELVPLETFLVNLSGDQGRKLVQLEIELEVYGEGIREEITDLRPKIRDIIVILLSGKSYQEMSNARGKEDLKNEIRDQVNLFLTKGKIRGIYFTQLTFS